MPLIKGKSPEAFKHNIKAEVHAGKPLKQSLAIAYSVKRKAAHKKMAKGGVVDDFEDFKSSHPEYEAGSAPPEDESSEMHEMQMKEAPQYASNSGSPYEKGMEEMAKKQMYAHGGMVDRIMRHKYSMGGVVANEGEDDLSHLADAKDNEFDDLALDDNLTASYPAGEDEHGDEQEDHDRKDMVSRIMKQKYMKKNHNPRPA